VIKVLVPIGSSERGGSQLELVRLVERMNADEFRFTAWLFGNGPIEDDLDRLGVEFTVWPRTTTRTPWGLYAMGRAMQREAPGLIYLHASRLIAWLARRRGIPCVERINMSRRPEAGGWSRYRAIDRCFTSLNTVAAAASGPIAAQLTSRGVPPEKVTVLHTFVDGERYRHPELRGEARRELGIPNDAVVVLNIGRLVAQKCQADFLETAARCLPADDSLHFVLCGSGKLESSLRRRAERLGLGGRFHMAEFTARPERMYAAADIMLHTARWEPLGNVILEAMSAALAVVATDVDGTREAVSSKEVGLLVPAGDVGAMEKAVMELARDGSLRRRTGEAARRHVGAEFSPGRVVPEYEELFRRLASGSVGR